MIYDIEILKKKKYVVGPVPIVLRNQTWAGWKTKNKKWESEFPHLWIINRYESF